MGGSQPSGRLPSLTREDSSSSKGPCAIEPETAIRALKVKAKVSRRARALKKNSDAALVASLDGKGNVPHTSEDFVNEQEANAAAPPPAKQQQSIWRPMDLDDSADLSAPPKRLPES